VLGTLGPYLGESFEPEGVCRNVLHLVREVRDVLRGLAGAEERLARFWTKRGTDGKGDLQRHRASLDSDVTNLERNGACCREIVKDRRKNPLHPRMGVGIELRRGHPAHVGPLWDAYANARSGLRLPAKLLIQTTATVSPSFSRWPSESVGSVAFRASSVSCRLVDHGDDEGESGEEEVVFTTLYPGLRRFAAVVGPIEVEPDDLVQEALARALAVGPLSELRDPGAYVRAIMVRLAANQRRSLGRRRTAIRFLEDRARHAAAVYPPDLVDLNVLDAEDRAVVYLSIIEQATSDEIGAALGWSAGRVRMRKHRALRRLRAEMEDNDG
jgi:DNA-directed RNA polymerase specialized sigma24 family protein